MTASAAPPGFKAWQPGDPIAPGLLYLPTAELRRAYGEACRDEIETGMARELLRMSGQEQRAWAEKWRARHGDESLDRIREHYKRLRAANGT